VSESEDSPVLESITRERMMKIQQAVKRFSGCCVDLCIVEISGDAVIACSSEWCV
jgi:hypothetical protein